MLGAGSISGDKRQVHLRGRHARKLNLRFLSRFLQTLHGHFIRREVNAVFLLEGVSHILNHTVVKIVAAQAVVAGSCQNLLHTVAHLDDGNVEGTAAEIIHDDLLVVFLVDAISQRRCGRLVDDTFNIKTSNASRIFGCLPLRVCEVGRNGDNRLGDRLA